MFYSVTKCYRLSYTESLTSIRNSNRAQTLVNTVARFITGRNRRTSTMKLMRDDITEFISVIMEDIEIGIT